VLSLGVNQGLRCNNASIFLVFLRLNGNAVFESVKLLEFLCFRNGLLQLPFRNKCGGFPVLKVMGHLHKGIRLEALEFGVVKMFGFHSSIGTGHVKFRLTLSIETVGKVCGEGVCGLGNKGLHEVIFHHLEEAARPFNEMGVGNDFGDVQGMVGRKAVNSGSLGRNAFAVNPQLHM